MYHPACAKIKLKEQLAAFVKKRKAGRPKKPMRPCKICGKGFQCKNPLYLYCSRPCYLKGRDQAVERQRLRRQEEKASREKPKPLT